MLKISIFQKDKKINTEFKLNGVVDKFVLDKADDFLMAIDKFRKKRKIDSTLFKDARLEIKQASLLTERIIRAILQGILIDFRK